MEFKTWIANEMGYVSLRQGVPIQVYESDSGHGPFHTATYNPTNIDMRFEDYSIEGQAPPQGNWAAPLANGKFIIYTAAQPHNSFIGDKPGMQSPDGQWINYPTIRQDWARFAQFVSGNTVIKPAQYDRGPLGDAGKFKSTLTLNPTTQNPSRLQSA